MNVNNRVMLALSLIFLLFFCLLCTKSRRIIKENPTGGPTGRIETNRVGMVFVELAPGSFIMGSESAESENEEKPLHKVVISRGFQIQTTEVTQAQWKAVMKDNPSSYVKDDSFPVETVSWYDCQLFIRRLNNIDPGKRYRLPTEAEWEYACRAGTTRDRYKDDLYDIASFGNDGLSKVGSFRPNEWGLYDTLGNLWEWCSDWSGMYPSEMEIDPHGPLFGSGKIMRGGSWSVDAEHVRASVRRSMDPNSRGDYIGFRLVRDAHVVFQEKPQRVLAK